MFIMFFDPDIPEEEQLQKWEQLRAERNGSDHSDQDDQNDSDPQ